MYDWDTPIIELEDKLIETEKKVGSWQKDVLVLLLKNVIRICYYLKSKDN